MAPLPKQASDSTGRRLAFLGSFALFLLAGIMVPAHTPAVNAPTWSIMRAHIGHSAGIAAQAPAASHWPNPALSEQLARAAFRVVMQMPSLDRALALDTPALGASAQYDAASAERRMNGNGGAGTPSASTNSATSRIARLLLPLAGNGSEGTSGGGNAGTSQAPFHISLSDDLKLNWALRSQPAGNARTELGVRVGLQYKF